eukprot:Opistho-2@37922
MAAYIARHAASIELISFAVVVAAPWILVNAVWVELPSYVDRLPEGYEIATRLALAVQCANVIPFAYGFIPMRLRPRLETTILSLMLVLVVLCACASSWWDATAQIASGEASVALIVITFLAGACGTLSNVTLWPYVSRFRPSVMLATSVGVGLSSLVPSIMGIGQHPGPHARFATASFFGAISGVAGVSFVTFCWVVCWKRNLPSQGDSEHPSCITAPSDGDCMKKEGDNADIYTRRTIDDTVADHVDGVSDGHHHTDAGETHPLLSDAASKQRRSRGQHGADTDAHKCDPGDNIDHANGCGAVFVAAQREAFPLCIMAYASVLNFFVPSVISYLPSRMDNASDVLLALTVSGMIAGTLGRIACIFAFASTPNAHDEIAPEAHRVGASGNQVCPNLTCTRGDQRSAAHDANAHCGYSPHSSVADISSRDALIATSDHARHCSTSVAPARESNCGSLDSIASATVGHCNEAAYRLRALPKKLVDAPTFSHASQSAPHIRRLIMALPPICVCVQTASFALLFVGGYPLGFSAILLVGAYAVASATFGCTSTLLYRRAVLFSGGSSASAEASCSRLAFAEQAGATLGTLVAFFLVQYGVIH